MASFTDKISQFNPYIQQLPAQEMQQVGMYKQQQYDQGVQKIQSYIDNVAGINVANAADKAYLQSKMNELGSKLKTVAAGDFSNQQLVSSVGGMATQIIKDENVQNAIFSTSNLQKQTQLAQDDAQKGTDNPYNTAEFNESANRYLNNGKVGQRFTDSYFKPRDVWKKLTDVAEKVGVDSTVVKQLFKTDSAGNRIMKPVFDKKGKKIGEEPDWNPIIATEKLKGKDAGKILAAFQNALDAGDYKQLAINGKWSKQGETPLQLREQVINTTKEQIDFTAGKIEAIKIELYKEENKNEKDPDRINLLTAQLEAFDKSHKNLIQSRDNNLSLLESDPLSPDYNNKLNNIRSSLYTNNFLHSTATELSSRDKDIDYGVNPIFTVTMETKRFNEQLNQDAIKNGQWQLSHNLAVQVAGNKVMQDQIENYFKYGIGDLPPGIKRTDFIKEPININDDPFGAKHQVEDGFSKSVQELNNTNYKLTTTWFKNINPQKTGETTAQYDDRIKKAIYDFAKGNGESVDATSGDINSYTARFAAKQLTDWKKNPGLIPAQSRDLLAKQDELVKDIVTQKGAIDNIKTQAYEIAKERGLDIPSNEDIKKNIKPTSVILNNGQQVALSAQDVTDFANLHPDAYNTFGGITVDKNQQELKTQSQKRLSLKWGKLFDAINNSLFTSGIGAGDEISYTAGLFSPTYGALGAVPLNKEVSDAVQFINKSKYGTLAKIESELYIKNGYIKQPVSMPILRGKENKDDINAKISTVIGKYSSGLNETPGYNADVMQAALLEDGSAVKTTVIPGSVANEPNKYQLTVTSKKTGKPMSVTIDEEDHQFLQNQKFANKSNPRILQQINMTGTSNLSGKEDPNTTWFGANDFKNLKGVNYTVTSDVVTDDYNKDKLWMKLYIHNADGTITNLTFPQPILKYNADGSLNHNLDVLPMGINDAVIQQIKSKKNQ